MTHQHELSYLNIVFYKHLSSADAKMLLQRCKSSMMKNEIRLIDKIRQDLDKEVRQVDRLHPSTILMLRRDHFVELLLHYTVISNRLKCEKTATVFAAW